MEKVIETLFSGLDDDYLKTVMKVAYCGEDPAILDEYEKQQKADLERIHQFMELKDSNPPLDDGKVIVEEKME